VTSSAFKRVTFEDQLARFADVVVSFVDHELLVTPSSVRPAEGRAQIFSYGLDMPVPIPDLSFDDSGISATLSFSRVPHATFVPWEAVVGIRGFGELLGRSAKTREPGLKLVP
jgi:hypothetical protein